MSVSEDLVPLRLADGDRGGQGRDDRSFERTPPQDVAAEQSVLGGMLLSKDAIADVVEIVRSGDFYRPAHQIVFDTVLDLYGRGEPADPVTVSAALADAGTLGRVGGAPYLHTLIASVPTAANAGYYARIVAERAVLRRLVEAGTRIVQLGYGSAVGHEVTDVVDMAQQAVYDVTEKRTSEDYVVLEELLQPTMDEIEAISSAGGVMSGVPTGFTDLDRLLNGLHPGQMIIVAGRPGLGKSTAGLDFVRSASIRNGLTSVIFSLEMSKVELTMRLLSAEARVPLHNLRSGRMSEDDWMKLARRMGEVSEAPLFIDDSPNMTMMEIRAKARRLKQRHDLRLVLIDYLQLMSSPKRTESRQQEVSELSRGMKLLAKELEVPVIAVSQLNRGPEQRTDKRPQLSDLRESGCLTGDTTVLRADTGAPVTLDRLISHGHEDVVVWSLDDRLTLVPAPITAVFPSGVKDVYEMTLASGLRIKGSANHPFLTRQGWRSLDELRVGDGLAVPRVVPEPLGVGLGWPEDRFRVLAHAMGSDSGPGSRQRADEIRLPDELHLASDEEIRVFLRHLLAADRDVVAHELTGDVPGQEFAFTTASRLLADGVRLLLCRLGVQVELAQRSLRDRSVYRLSAVTAQSKPAGPESAGAVGVLWDPVASIKPLGPQPVYDATVKGTHNFVADGIVAHNSIEQDADVVILLHRDDYYEKESPRAGEADFIVAKHRNGPTDTVTVAFQGHYSRFVDMSTGM